MKAIAKTHNYYLFTANGVEIRTGKGKGPANLTINIGSGFRDLLRAGGMYGDPIPLTQVLAETDTGETITGICLNEDVLRPKTIAAVKIIFREIEATGKEMIDILDLIDTNDHLEKVFDAIINDPGDPYGLVWQRLRIWETNNNIHLRADRKKWEAEDLEDFGTWGAREPQHGRVSTYQMRARLY